MFFILSKILFFFLQPLVWVLVFLLIGILSKSQIRKKRFILFGFVFLLFFSNQFIFNEFNRLWENKIPSYKGNDTFDVAVVLGGISAYDEFHEQQALFGNSERLFNVLPLYFEGRVNKILFSGGSGRIDKKNIEADFIRGYLLKLGVKNEDIILENKSRNTYENAKFTTQLISSEQKILLSTSATHMPRSLACFQKLDFHPTPFPVDYSSNQNNRFSFSLIFIPDPYIMVKWYWLFHELVGIQVYKIKGYC